MSDWVRKLILLLMERTPGDTVNSWYSLVYSNSIQGYSEQATVYIDKFYAVHYAIFIYTVKSAQYILYRLEIPAYSGQRRLYIV